MRFNLINLQFVIKALYRKENSSFSKVVNTTRQRLKIAKIGRRSTDRKKKAAALKSVSENPGTVHRVFGHIAIIARGLASLSRTHVSSLVPVRATSVRRTSSCRQHKLARSARIHELYVKCVCFLCDEKQNKHDASRLYSRYLLIASYFSPIGARSGLTM